MNVVIYSRVSSQTARQSTDRQVEDLRNFAVIHGYTVCAVFEEKVSGSKTIQERFILQDCLEYCINPNNQVELLLVSEISRLSRSPLELLKALDLLHRNNISVYIQNLNIETLLPDKNVNPLASIITTLLAELASVEKQNIIYRLNSGRALHIKKGGKLGRKPGTKKSHEQKKIEYKEAISLLKKGYSIRNTAKITGKSIATILMIKREFIDGKTSN